MVGLDNFNDYYDVSLKERRAAGLADREGFELARGDIRDRDLLEGLFPPREDRAEGPDFGAGAVYTQSEAAGSRLVNGDVTAVSYEGTAYPVTVETRPATIRRYRYEVTQVAADGESLGRRYVERYRFALTGLTDAERDVVEQAIDGGYYEGSASDAFESLVRELRRHDRVGEEESDGEQYIVRYEGTDYWTEVYAPFVDE